MFARNVSKRLSRALVFAFSITVLCMMFSSTASAQPGNNKTTVTFSAPVEIPGVGAHVLPAGTYVFTLLDSLSDRNIVQILNMDESHVYATILAIPNYRLKATDKTVMTFAETAAGDPQAIRAWFYPGENWGREFVYPKAKAVELAKITKLPVLYIPDDVAPNIVAPVKTATEPPVIALKEVPVKAVKPTGEDVAIAEVIAPLFSGSTGSSATPTVNPPAKQVLTGGFGDPDGMKGEGRPDKPVNIASLGSFDLPVGAGARNPAPTVRKRDTEAPQSALEITFKPRPDYAEEARKLKVEGEVLVMVLFTASGQVKVLGVSRGCGHGLDENAVRAAEQIRFKPAEREGTPVDSTATVHIVFQLAY